MTASRPTGRGRRGVVTAGAFAVGAAGWTLMEYGLHRFAMHAMRGRGLASREHLAHHADIEYFAPTSKKLLTALGVTAAVLPVSWRLAGRRTGIAFTSGMIGTYYVYEVLHRKAHTDPPRTRYGRWLRHNHFQHHFGAPMRNHGVTVGVWDRAFGTADDDRVVRVPRRMAMVWLVDDDGVLRPEYADHYELVGRATMTSEDREADREAAFANRIPVA